MQDHPDQIRPRPARVTGPARILAAAGHSLAGARRLWREPACRHELLAGGIVLVLFAVKGAELVEVVAFLILSLIVFATEALNTALEEVVDHLSPDWAVFAKHAKDLGSFAVLCQLAAAGLLALYVLID